MSISVTILTKNNAKTLPKTLDCLKSFSEVIVLDSGSTDETLEIAKNYPNVSIHTSPFMGFGPMHNYATKLATHDWILSLDSDEVLTDELLKEIHALDLDPEKIYSMQRHNFYNGKQMKYCAGWSSDTVLRLYNRKQTAFSDDLVHEKVLQKELEIQKLQHPVEHTPYLEISDFLHKMQHYTTLFAEQTEKSEDNSIFQALGHSWFAFIKSYLFKRGFLGGKEGFIISMYNAHTAFYKYLKLSEKK